ncbi:unnamed protein product [Linum trigynum]|uniref:Uncharacterized protein n=1 Tax=Linum trigynum TaxID=586398 RepID=A0AAV2C8Z1_9ROSI
MKRKEFQEEDFSSPFNSHPAKSRRLDGDVLQSLEVNPRFRGEELMEEYLEFGPQNAVDEVLQTAASVAGDAIPLVGDSDEKAIVLYQPPTLPRSPSSPEFSIVLDSNLIPGLRDRIWWPGTRKQDESVEEKLAAEKNVNRSNNSMAVIPWVAPQLFMSNVADGEAMEAEDTDMMDTDETPASYNCTVRDVGVGGKTERKESQFQWQPQQQQWMMLPGVIQNIHTPITW